MIERELWALHIKGPDDILPMVSKRLAELEAHGWGGVAEVVKWPYSAESHAAALSPTWTDSQLIAAARIANPYITDADIPLALPQWRRFLAALAALQGGDHG
jgi:hypothetical protein